MQTQIGVTKFGAVDEQLGTYEIEGFFRLCRARRLTGRQGVVLPQANAGDLMLDRDVVEAVERGQFHVYPVATVEEAVIHFTDVPMDELLTRAGAVLSSFRRAATGQ